MSSSRDQQRFNEPKVDLSPPDIIGVLDPAPGGEENLLRKDAWLLPLRVEFELWSDAAPESGMTDTVRLFWKGEKVDEKFLQGPIQNADLWLRVPAAKLDEGVHPLYYQVVPWNNSTPRECVPVNVTIDKTPPILAADSELVFPSEVLPPNKLTAHYLELNNDEVKANLPPYTTPRPWDRITWYWGATPGSQYQGGVIELDDQNYADPLEVTIPGDVIRDRGDGWRYVWYEAQDRAGNLSLRSEPVELEVAATPIPRTLPPCSVKEAPGGSSSGVLKPLDAVNGVTVIIPSEAVIYDGEGVFVQWAEPGTVGAFRTDSPNPAGSRDYKIPSDKIAQHLGKTISVIYEVFEPGIVEPHKSNNYSLRVEELTGLPTVQCDKVSGGRLSLASIAAGGYASFTLARWTFMAVDQYLTIEVRGVDSSNQLVRIPVLTESPVPEVAQTIPAGRISKSDLQGFKIGGGLEVRVSVSFDARQTWKSFPMLTPTLVA
ncbi:MULTISPECIES: hypothetical protein [Pseudomonas]|uniref:hypothetical protein n=1 Tax=Pseudomonas TaxID=286 RepID=UPI001BEC6ABE|nr:MULTISPECIES: hypothetical protein [Pseudomonas]MBT2341802.1 hypothetical protein [Pseudomonas fluorescens]MCD4530474.1 hypothetical protein [Pseudomonas sp. C3-2018]